MMGAAERGQLATVRRESSTVMVICARRLLRLLRDSYPSRAQVVAEADGWSVFIPGLPVAGDGATFDEAIVEMTDALREYADDWQDRLYPAPNHADNWGLVHLIALSTDGELREWLAGRHDHVAAGDPSRVPAILAVLITLFKNPLMHQESQQVNQHFTDWLHHVKRAFCRAEGHFWGKYSERLAQVIPSHVHVLPFREPVLQGQQDFIWNTGHNLSSPNCRRRYRPRSSKGSSEIFQERRRPPKVRLAWRTRPGAPA
jgi:hypothetical protein